MTGDQLVPWSLAVEHTIEALDAAVEVAVLTGNWASEPRDAVRHLTTALLILAACKERERLARNEVAQQATAAPGSIVFKATSHGS